jgi:hypothetical protein
MEVEKRRVEREGRNAVVRVRRVIVNVIMVEVRGYIIIGEVSGGFFFGSVEGEGERSGELEEGEGGGEDGEMRERRRERGEKEVENGENKGEWEKRRKWKGKKKRAKRNCKTLLIWCMSVYVVFCVVIYPLKWLCIPI